MARTSGRPYKKVQSKKSKRPPPEDSDDRETESDSRTEDPLAIAPRKTARPSNSKGKRNDRKGKSPSSKKRSSSKLGPQYIDSDEGSDHSVEELELHETSDVVSPSPSRKKGRPSISKDKKNGSTKEKSGSKSSSTKAASKYVDSDDEVQSDHSEEELEADETVDAVPPTRKKGRHSVSKRKNSSKGKSASKSSSTKAKSKYVDSEDEAVSEPSEEELEAQEVTESKPDHKPRSSKGGIQPRKQLLPTTLQKRPAARKGSNVSTKKAKIDVTDSEPDDTEYEIDRILDVRFHHDKREFQIKWKGYRINEATWEPEENLSCNALIEAFMSKVDKLKERVPRETRVDRKQTQRYFDSNRNAGVRTSRRNSNKPRTTYHGQED